MKHERKENCLVCEKKVIYDSVAKTNTCGCNVTDTHLTKDELKECYEVQK